MLKHKVSYLPTTKYVDNNVKKIMSIMLPALSTGSVVMQPFKHEQGDFRVRL